MFLSRAPLRPASLVRRYAMLAVGEARASLSGITTDYWVVFGAALNGIHAHEIPVCLAASATCAATSDPAGVWQGFWQGYTFIFLFVFKGVKKWQGWQG
jgi:hypothetical protein